MLLWLIALGLLDGGAGDEPPEPPALITQRPTVSFPRATSPTVRFTL